VSSSFAKSNLINKLREAEECENSSLAEFSRAGISVCKLAIVKHWQCWLIDKRSKRSLVSWSWMKRREVLILNACYRVNNRINTIWQSRAIETRAERLIAPCACDDATNFGMMTTREREREREREYTFILMQVGWSSILRESVDRCDRFIRMFTPLSIRRQLKRRVRINGLRVLSLRLWRYYRWCCVQLLSWHSRDNDANEARRWSSSRCDIARWAFERLSLGTFLPFSSLRCAWIRIRVLSQNFVEARCWRTRRLQSANFTLRK